MFFCGAGVSLKFCSMWFSFLANKEYFPPHILIVNAIQFVVSDDGCHADIVFCMNYKAPNLFAFTIVWTKNLLADSYLFANRKNSTY